MSAQDVRSAIQQILDSQMEAWGRGYAEAFVRDFASDALFVTVRGDFVQGREAIKGNHAFVFDGPYKGSRLTSPSIG